MLRPLSILTLGFALVACLELPAQPAEDGSSSGGGGVSSGGSSSSGSGSSSGGPSSSSSGASSSGGSSSSSGGASSSGGPSSSSSGASSSGGSSSSSGGSSSSSGGASSSGGGGTTLAVNSGGDAAGGFLADAFFSGGSTSSTTSAVDTSLLAGDVPPASVLQTERYGDFTYTIPDRAPNASQTVTLYFQESYWTAAGQRTFDVAVNGQNVLQGFDIFAAAGGANRAIAKTFTTTADAGGRVVIAFTGTGVDHPKVCGLTVAGETSSGGSSSGGSSSGGSSSGGDGYQPCPADGTACRIMPLGDSITDGFNVQGGYRLELFRLAGTGGKAVTFVGSGSNGPATVDGRPFPPQHEGHSGYTIDDSGGTRGIYPLVQRALTTHRPHVVLLMIGTNDVNYGLDLANAPRRLELLIDRIFQSSPGALVVVAQIVPAGSAGRNPTVQAYNAGVAEVVRRGIAAGEHLALVDMYGEFTANPRFASELLADGIHPTANGYAVMGRAWYRAIEAFLPGAR